MFLHRLTKRIKKRRPPPALLESSPRQEGAVALFAVGAEVAEEERLAGVGTGDGKAPYNVGCVYIHLHIYIYIHIYLLVLSREWMGMDGNGGCWDYS